MWEITTVGLDLAKNLFQADGADASGQAVLRKKLPRDQVLAFFSQLQPCVVAMEACGGAHFWGSEIGNLGHDVRRIPANYVKPFVKRQRWDGCHPPQTASRCAKVAGVQRHAKERKANEGLVYRIKDGYW